MARMGNGRSAVPIVRPRQRWTRSVLQLRRLLRRTSVIQLRAAPGAGPRRGAMDPDREMFRLPASLVEETLAGNCVAFVGAGFSAAARLPGWKQLLLEIADAAPLEAALAEHVRVRIAHGSSHALDEAAQLLEDALGREGFVAELRQRLARPPAAAAMERRLRWLRGIPFRLVLTTNFDGVLEGPVAGHGTYRRALRPGLRWWKPELASGAGAPVVKLHGDLAVADDPSAEIVLTRRDYRRRLYHDAAYATFLRAVLSTTTVLYLGFSFEDAYLNELRSEVLALLGQRHDSAPVAYAIVNDAPAATREHFRRHEGIELLPYDSHGGTDFSGFDGWLAALYEATNPLLRFGRHLAERRILWVDPHPENNELACRFFDDAAAASGRALDALVREPDAEAGLQRLREAGPSRPFDLLITHWGEDRARDEGGHPVPSAIRLLHRIRSEDLRVPVIVFASARDAARRRAQALRLGAREYFYSFEGLLRGVDGLFASDGDGS